MSSSPEIFPAVSPVPLDHDADRRQIRLKYVMESVQQDLRHLYAGGFQIRPYPFYENQTYFKFGIQVRDGLGAMFGLRREFGWIALTPGIERNGPWMAGVSIRQKNASYKEIVAQEISDGNLE